MAGAQIALNRVAPNGRNCGSGTRGGPGIGDLRALPRVVCHDFNGDETIPRFNETISLRLESTRKPRFVMVLLVIQEGSIMWDIIINLIYHQSCRKYLAAARKQSELWI
jgi:hypothetical protein